MTTNELLPCPFCGSTPDINNEWTFQADQGTKWGYVVCCCNGPEVRTGYGPVEEWRDDAIAAWNQRATPQADPEREKRIEEWANHMNSWVRAFKQSFVLTGIGVANLEELIREAVALMRSAPRASSQPNGEDDGA